jgi:hypothetical protein
MKKSVKIVTGLLGFLMRSTPKNKDYRYLKKIGVINY